MEKQPQRPVLGALETQLSFEEAQSLCALHRCAFEDCRLTGANFSAGALADVRFFGCVAQSAAFSECGMKAVLFEQTDLSGAAFCDIGLRRRAAFAF